MTPNTMNKIIKATRHAREKHPEFAPGITQALCLAQEELGEMAKAINDNAPWAEIESEIYDTIAAHTLLRKEKTEKPILHKCKKIKNER